jgi:hypothetical protein
MSEASVKTYKDVLWEGRPWTLPSALARTKEVEKSHRVAANLEVR